MLRAQPPVEDQPDAAAVSVPLARSYTVVDGGTTTRLTVLRRGIGPIRHGASILWHLHFEVDDRWRDYHVLAAPRRLTKTSMPIFAGEQELILRIDSGCFTGHIFRDQTCECRQQLDRAMRLLADRAGLVIAIPSQDGRGMGLDFKLGTLMLQYSSGIDTVDAARALTGNDLVDVRTYGGAVAILRFLGITVADRIRLLTNNPSKAVALAQNGYERVRVAQLRVPVTPLAAANIKAKREKLGHTL